MKAVEPSRTRERGTEVSRTTSGKERIEACRRIIKRGQYAKIDGTMVDLYSASVIVGVYDALSSAAKAKMETFSIGRMADVAYKVLAKTS